jgi:transcriptional regulator with XRE-family HTH domain
VSELRKYLIRNLKRRRTYLGISQAELAERAGISAGFVGEMEMGRKAPSLEVLDHLAAALDVEPFRLLMGPGDVADVGGKEAIYEAASAMKESLASGMEAALRSLESEKDARDAKRR